MKNELMRDRRPSILTYAEGRELIEASNERFKGTGAEIYSDGKKGEVRNADILQRLALLTTMYHNHELALRKKNKCPISPRDSEFFLSRSMLPRKGNYDEDLALILFDIHGDGANPQEARALYESISHHISEIEPEPPHTLEEELKRGTLEKSLLVIDPGLEVDSNMPHGVRPIVLPQLTDVIMHSTLEMRGQYPFIRALEDGIPYPEGLLEKGNRTLSLPNQRGVLGLRILTRLGKTDLITRRKDLANKNPHGRITFANYFGQTG